VARINDLLIANAVEMTELFFIYATKRRLGDIFRCDHSSTHGLF